MEQRQLISLRGIQRNNPDGVSGDGTCQEIINMRPRDGAWRVVGAKEQIKTHSSTQRYHFLHQISPTRRAWWVTSTAGGAKNIAYYLEDADGNSKGIDATFDTFSSTPDQVSFAALGNVVIMIDQAAEVIQAYLFEADTDTYCLVGDLLPDLIPATIRESASGFTYNASVPTASWSDEAGEAALAVAIADMRTSGILVNKLYYVYAYELFDGSVVKHSQPIRIGGSTFGNFATDGSNEVAACAWNNVNFTILSSATLSSIKTNYKGIIKAINVYVSAPSELHTVSSKVVSTDDRKINGVLTFYKIKSWSLEELTAAAMPVSWIYVGDLTTLETNEQLPYDNNTAHTIYSADPFNYNQRMFWSKVKNTLFGGFHPDMSNPYGASGVTGFTLYCEVTIETDQGVKIVRSAASSSLNYTSYTGHLACFAYPDRRASKVKIIVRRTSTGVLYFDQEYALTPHPHHNFSYREDVPFDASASAVYATEKKTYWDYNRVQASEIMNPFYFPTNNSYRVGRGTIVGLATNALAISTGQFGEYPIYAFSSDGIWTLQIGDGSILVQSIKPLSRHVCNNADSILSIDGGCTFSTEKGLHIISGAQIVEISQVSEGLHTSVISSNSDLIALLSATGAGTYVCDDKFLDYLSGSVMGYDYIENEILVSNPSYDYSWAYNISNSAWYKRSQVWDAFFSDFPAMYGANYTNRDVENITSELTTGTQIIHIETRPLMLGVVGLKKITRALIESTFAGEYAKTFALQVYGSADGRNYYLVYNDTSVNSSNLQRLLIGRMVCSCEYYILVISSSGMGVGKAIKMIIADVTSRWGGKLRVDM